MSFNAGYESSKKPSGGDTGEGGPDGSGRRQLNQKTLRRLRDERSRFVTAAMASGDVTSEGYGMMAEEYVMSVTHNRAVAVRCFSLLCQIL